MLTCAARHAMELQVDCSLMWLIITASMVINAVERQILAVARAREFLAGWHPCPYRPNDRRDRAGASGIV
jgi:hypothetical protein